MQKIATSVAFRFGDYKDLEQGCIEYNRLQNFCKTLWKEILKNKTNRLILTRSRSASLN